MIVPFRTARRVICDRQHHRFPDRPRTPLCVECAPRTKGKQRNIFQPARWAQSERQSRTKPDASLLRGTEKLRCIEAVDKRKNPVRPRKGREPAQTQGRIRAGIERYSNAGRLGDCIQLRELFGALQFQKHPDIRESAALPQALECAFPGYQTECARFSGGEEWPEERSRAAAS